MHGDIDLRIFDLLPHSAAGLKSRKAPPNHTDRCDKTKRSGLGNKSGSLTKLGIFTFGSMVKNQMIATPQKKNMNPF